MRRKKEVLLLFTRSIEAPSTKTSSASPSTALQETSTVSPPSWSTKSTSGEESKTGSIPAPDYSTTQSPRPPSATLIPSVSTLRPVEPQTIYPTTKQVLPPGPIGKKRGVIFIEISSLVYVPKPLITVMTAIGHS